MRLSHIGVLAGLVFSLTSAASAHHAFNMYDNGKYVNIKGTVKEYHWTNPHVYLFVLARAPDGKMEEWSIECSSLNIIGRKGWTPNSLKAGDAVDVTTHPMKDGSKVGLMVSVKTPDGHVLKDKT